MTTLFISDLHLDADRPESTAQFLDFMESEASQAEALYILGDLFEAWIGDDDTNSDNALIIAALATLKFRGVPCYFMHGNRDFLVGRRFATATGCELLTEIKVVEIAGDRVLLTHGDLLCTDDEPYMALRAAVRDAAWQREFLAKPAAERRHIADDLRAKSQAATAAKTEEIMDVNQDAVETAMRDKEVSILLHGHTHRPNVHKFDIDGVEATRIVLGAWYEQGSVVRWDENGFELATL